MIRNGSYGVMDGDQSDVLDAIVFQHTNLNESEIFRIVKNNKMFIGVPDSELKAYIKDSLMLHTHAKSKLKKNTVVTREERQAIGRQRYSNAGENFKVGDKVRDITAPGEIFTIKAIETGYVDIIDAKGEESTTDMSYLRKA